MRRVSQDVFDGSAEVPPVLKWMSEEEFALYEAEFRRTGFTGGLNWYRNLDRNWELSAGVAGRTIEVPTMFLAGERDPALTFLPVEPMRTQVRDLREFVMVAGAGHWIQQERPAETNEVLLRFLGGLSL
jgi:pimeloyl-ACP methyl ester carboxylesterase